MKIRNVINKILITVLSAVFAAAAFSGCGAPKLPDYSQSDAHFEFFGYTPPTDGTYTVNGEEFFAGENFISVERYKEYKDAGFTILNTIYGGEMWETSDAKKTLELGYEAGIDKIIVTDRRIWGLIDGGKTFDDEDFKYRNEAELDEYVYTLMKDYAVMPGFYGLVLMDEPNYHKQESYGMVYKSVKRVAAEKFGIDDLYIHMNFLPNSADDSYYSDDNSDQAAAYRSYLEGFLKETGTDRISVDTYAFHSFGIAAGFYPSLQILRDLCTQYEAEMSYCLQSFNMYNGAVEYFREVDKSAMYLEINSLVGFGASNFGYYTYMPMQSNTTDGSFCTDSGSFLNRKGEKNNIYYYGQEIMASMKKFEKVVLNYDFCGAKFFTHTPAQYKTSSYFMSNANKAGSIIEFDNGYELKLLKNYKIDNDISLVTELYDEKNDLYMYMLLNAIDPMNSEKGETSMTVEADFGKEYKYVAEFDCGELSYVKLDDGVYKNTLSAGYAVYLIPLK